jgi:hypothetical protein
MLKKLSSKKELCNWSICANFIALIFIIVISIFYLYISSQNSIVGLVADDAMYLLMADYFSPYYSSLSQSSSFIMEASKFPPLYPMLLAIFGASSENILIAHVLTTSCFIGAVIMYIFWIGKDQKNKSIGLYLALILICLPASFLMNIDLWSEHLYLLFTMCALFFIEKANINTKYWLIAALFIGFLPIVRLVGITFVCAFFIYLHMHKVHYRYRYILVSIFPFLIWKASAMNFILPVTYGSIVAKFYQHDIWLIIENLFFVQLQNLWDGWHECFDVQKNIWSGVISAVVLMMALPTWFLRIINKKIDSLYLLFYLMLIWLWPAPDHDMRFMFVIFPILLYYSYLSLSFLFTKYSMGNIEGLIKYMSMFIILATFLPTNLYAINRLFSQDLSTLEPYKNTRYWMTTSSSGSVAENSTNIINQMFQSYIFAGQIIPKDKCVYTVHPEQFMFYSRKLAFPLPLPEDVKNNNITQYLGQCEYIHVLNTSTHPYFPGGYPTDLLGDNFDYLMMMRMSEEPDSPIVATLIQLH